MLRKITLYIIIVTAIVSVFILASKLSYTPLQETRIDTEMTNVTLQVSSPSWGIFDPETGEILEGKNINDVRSIASLTKLFTAYVAINNNDVDTKLIINWNDIYTEGHSGKLSHNERISPRELLFPLLIESSNDAGEAIRRGLGDEFYIVISLLHEELGLVDTHIVDGSGLSRENVSTISELAIFYAYLRRNQSHLLDITQLRLYVSEKTGYVNNNPGREFDTFTGGKNGYTTEAGRTFVGTFLLDDGSEVGIVFLGSGEIKEDIEHTLEYLNNSR